MNTKSILLFLVLLIIPLIAFAERPSLQSLQQQIDDLQAQVDAIPAVGDPIIEFVGFSSTTFNGGQGVFTYTKACQQDYPGSRMCKSMEFLETSNLPNIQTSITAWIRPHFVPFAQGSTTVPRTLDMSGVFGITNDGITCSGWSLTYSDYKGLIVDQAGKFGTNTCDTELPIACCAQVN